MAGKKKSEILDDLKPRERKYVEGRVSGKSKKQAALAAGYSESMANSAVAKIETPNVRAAFQRAVRAAIPESKIVGRLSEGLDAEHSRPVISGKEVIDTITEPDYRERREYLSLAAKFGGYHIDKHIVETEERKLDDLTDEELAVKAKQLAELVGSRGSTAVQ